MHLFARRQDTGGRRIIRVGVPLLVAALLGNLAAFAGPSIGLGPTVAVAAPSPLQATQAKLRAAKAELSALQAKLDDLASQAEKAEARLDRTEGRLQEVEAKTADARKKLARLREQLSVRVVEMYKDRGSDAARALESIFGGENQSFTSVLNQISQLNRVADSDRELISEVAATANELSKLDAELQREKNNEAQDIAQNRLAQKRGADALDTAKDDYNRLHDGVALLQEQERRQREEAQKRAEAEAAAKAAAARAAASRAADARRPPAKAPAKPAAKRNAAVAGAKWVFPVQGPNSFSHSFGAPRYAGGYHTHKGVDIMAPRGTPVVAVTAGVIRSTSPVERGLGGITIHLRGSDGNVYYYAHLSSVKNGIAPGVRVKAGQLIGYVGNTGDARSTAPHLHFEIRPGGGAAIDPYPTLIKYR